MRCGLEASMHGQKSGQSCMKAVRFILKTVLLSGRSAIRSSGDLDPFLLGFQSENWSLDETSIEKLELVL